MGMPLSLAQTGASDFEKINEGLKKLIPLIGKWKAVALFHDGHKVTENDGSYEIDWALEKTYLQCQAKFHRKDDPSSSSWLRHLRDLQSCDPSIPKHILLHAMGTTGNRNGRV